MSATGEPAESARTVDELRAELVATRRQLHRVRLTLLRLLCLLGVSALVAGLLLPAWTEHGRTYRVGGIAFGALPEVLADRHRDPLDVAFLVGYLGLLVVCVAAVCALAVIGIGESPLPGWWVYVAIGALALVGGFVPGLFSLLAFGSDEPGTTGGSGGVVLFAGVIVYLATVGSATVRELRFRTSRPTNLTARDI